jgi:hypothetical protein
MYETWEEGSHLKEYTYKYNGGTGKYERASGGGTYMYESWTNTLTGGTYQGKLVLPWYMARRSRLPCARQAPQVPKPKVRCI